MKYKNKIKAVFKAIGRVFVVLIGIALIIYLTIDIGVKPPLMANRNAKNNAQIYSMENNNNYWTTYNEYNYISDLEFDPLDLDYQFDSFYNAIDDEFYIEEYSFNDGFDSYITFGLNLELLDPNEIQANCEFYVGLHFTDFTSIEDDNYYYFYSSMITSPYEGDSVVDYSYSIGNIFSYSIFSNPILKGSFIKSYFEYLGFSVNCALIDNDSDSFAGSYVSIRLGLYDLSGFVDFIYQDGYDVGFDGGYTGGYIEGNEEGYEEGYETGVVTGIDSVLSSPNSYGLYDEQQYISYGQNQYGSGYNNGLAANGVVGLDWFKASISVVNDFLNIMILPNVTIGNIFAGMIILLILSWVLSWFRG